MSLARTAPRPRDLFFALLAAAAAAHTGFVIVLTWLRPELGISGVAGLFILPFLFIAVGFIPVVFLLTLLRIVLMRFVPAMREGSIALIGVLAVVGILLACAIAWVATGWIADEQISSSVLFGAAVGGVVAGMRLGSEPKKKESLL
jgi:hypothetical protein